MRKRLAGIAMVAIALLASGCSSTSSGFSGSSGGKHTVRFVQQPWSDDVVETQVAMQVLDKLGYKASTQEVSVPLGAQALATGQADAYLANWWPSQKADFAKYIAEKKIDVAGMILTGTEYSPAVPGYVVQSLGVRSLADLNKHAAAFGRKIYGIEPGAPANDTIQQMISKNDYGLKGWQLVASSTDAMLAQVTRLAAQKQPIVFLGWSPHWMTTQFDLHFLADPQHVWPGAGEIRSVIRGGLKAQDPNVARFISQISFDTVTASNFIKMVDKQHVSAAKVAAQWIQENPAKVAVWLKGVKSVKGAPALQVVQGKGGGK